MSKATKTPKPATPAPDPLKEIRAAARTITRELELVEAAIEMSRIADIPRDSGKPESDRGLFAKLISRSVKESLALAKAIEMAGIRY